MPPLEAIWRRYIKAAGKPLFEPGSTAVYNNFNYLALGVIFEKTTGSDLLITQKTAFFKPLGMNHTAYFSEDLAGRAEEALPVPNRLFTKDTIAALEQVGYAGKDTVAAESDGIRILPSLRYTFRLGRSQRYGRGRRSFRLDVPGHPGCGEQPDPFYRNSRCY